MRAIAHDSNRHLVLPGPGTFASACVCSCPLQPPPVCLEASLRLLLGCPQREFRPWGGHGKPFCFLPLKFNVRVSCFFVLYAGEPNPIGEARHSTVISKRMPGMAESLWTCDSRKSSCASCPCCVSRRGGTPYQCRAPWCGHRCIERASDELRVTCNLSTCFSSRYHKFWSRWGSTHAFHRFSIWAGFALRGGLWCWELLSSHTS
jgi:hypothetical protein